jgi:large subunit ribosomal protein L9
MQIVLLERIAKLGQMGDVVTVKDGYARNFLLPQGKALRANKSNLERFETERAQLEARNLERREEAEAVSVKLDGQNFVVIRQSGDSGQLYGSVTPRDISELLSAGGFDVSRNQVAIEQPIKNLGLHTVSITLHPEVACSVIVNVARTDDEAKRQEAGEDVTVEPGLEEEATLQVEEVFEEGVSVEVADEVVELADDAEVEAEAEVAEAEVAEAEVAEAPAETEEEDAKQD